MVKIKEITNWLTKNQYNFNIQKEIDYDLKSGESDCGFFIFKTSKIRKLIKFLINKKMIISKKI